MERFMTMTLKKTAIATATVACAWLSPLGWSEQHGLSLGIESAEARVGRPLTPLSVAGVARRQNRRAAYGGYGYRYGAGAVGAGLVTGLIGAAIVANQPYGYGEPYYGGYVNRSYVTGRRTIVPRYYGGYAADPYYGAYATGGYPVGYGGGYANRSYITGRPTIIPRYYGGFGW